MKRRWRTTLHGQGSTPSEALAALLEDPLAGHIEDRPHHWSSVPSITISRTIDRLEMVNGWRAEATIAVERDDD